MAIITGRVHTTGGLLGISEMQVNHSVDAVTEIQLRLFAYPGYDPTHLLNEDWSDMFPGDAIVKCRYCGQFGARKTACKSCGASID